MKLGKAIKLCRMQRDMSQVELAKRAGLSTAYLSLLEKDERDPTLSTLESIASALKVPLSILLFLAAEKDEITELSPELAEKMSYVVLKLMQESYVKSEILG